MSTLLTSWETCNNENHLMPLIYLAVVVALLVSNRASIRFPSEPIRHFAEKWVFVGRVLATHFVHGPTINYSRRVAWAYFLRVVTAPRPGGKRKRKQRGQNSNKMHGMAWNGMEWIINATKPHGCYQLRARSYPRFRHQDPKGAPGNHRSIP